MKNYEVAQVLLNVVTELDKLWKETQDRYRGEKVTDERFYLLGISSGITQSQNVIIQAASKIMEKEDK